MELIKLCKVLREGDELIRIESGDESRKKQDLKSRENHFRKLFVCILFLSTLSYHFVLPGARDSDNNGEMTGTAKKSLLELEKTFNDRILGELKNGTYAEQRKR